jgi:hypothetical protein
MPEPLLLNPKRRRLRQTQRVGRDPIRVLL